MTPRELFDYARKNFIFCIPQHKNGQMKQKIDLKNALTITGTQKLYSFIPVSQEEVEVKTVSAQDERKNS